jgi:anion-transporting  ArsA/GET3 family ATPase
MARTKPTTNMASLMRHRQELERNLEKIREIEARNTELREIITKEEDFEYAAVARSYSITLEQLHDLLKGFRNGKVPFPMVKNETNEEDNIYETHL